MRRDVDRPIHLKAFVPSALLARRTLGYNSSDVAWSGRFTGRSLEILITEVLPYLRLIWRQCRTTDVALDWSLIMLRSDEPGGTFVDCICPYMPSR